MVTEPVLPAAPVLPDRRLRRRRETIEEVLDVAAEIMAEQGVAGLSIGEIARRMGIRPPSLYVYFPSKHALYDALFERGARAVLEALAPQLTDRDGDTRTLEEMLNEAAEAFVRWSIENAAYSQLLFWRPVPGFAPSPQAYEPAVRLLEMSTQRFAALQRRGLVRDDLPSEAVQADWTVLIGGVVSQQLANAPQDSFETGRFTAALPRLVAMFAGRYASPDAPAKPDQPIRGRRGHRRAAQR